MTGRPLPAAVLAALALAGPGVAQSPLLEAGVSRELARHRSRTLSDLSYDVSLRVPADRDSAVTGSVTIAVRKIDEGPLILDFADPDAVRSVSVDGARTLPRRLMEKLLQEADPLFRAVALREGSGP